MAGLLLPMLLDAIGGGHSGYHEMAAMTSTAQDSSADSNVWNTQGPSANHGSINFNFHVNSENITSPTGSNAAHNDQSPQLKELFKQNHFLKTIISQIAPSIIPEAAVQPSRLKRSVKDEADLNAYLVWGARPPRFVKKVDDEKFRCRGSTFRCRRTTTTPKPYVFVRRDSDGTETTYCYNRTLGHFQTGSACSPLTTTTTTTSTTTMTTTTTSRPFLPHPLFEEKNRPGNCVLKYFEKALRTFRKNTTEIPEKKLNNSNDIGK